MKENVRNVSEKLKNMRLNSVSSKTQKITSLWIIYTTGDLNWFERVNVTTN